ncbi:trans-sialidase [Trypanosoma cruzi]|nr:trans-sialidase [Trypanosoma cruzi]
MVQGFLRADCCPCGSWLILRQQRSPPGTAVSMSIGVWVLCAAISVLCGASPCGENHVTEITFELGKRWRLLCGCAPAFCVAVTRAALQHRLFAVLLWVLCMVPTCGRFCVGGGKQTPLAASRRRGRRK